MSKTAHTPGPWTAKWSKYSEATYIVQAGMPTNRVLARFDGDGFGPDDQSLADANLIAAAPELLDTLTALLEVHDAMGAGQSHAATKARAALAKATGAA